MSYKLDHKINQKLEFDYFENLHLFKPFVIMNISKSIQLNLFESSKSFTFLLGLGFNDKLS